MEDDSVKLLRECDAGVKTGIDAIEKTMDTAEAAGLRSLLERSRKHHEKLGREIGQQLDQRHEDGKDPNPVARSMSHMKTDVKLGMKPEDGTVASLITDGCDMGIRSLNRYMNEFAAADEPARALALRVIDAEKELRDRLQKYL